MPNSNDHSLRNGVARILREQRETIGMTQSELATQLSAQQSFVSKYEAGERKLDVVELLYICQALEISLTALAAKVEMLWEDRNASE